MPEIESAIRRDIEAGGVRFTATVFGKINWSLAPLQRAEDGSKDFADTVGRALRGLGADRAYAPTPTEFNGEIISPRELRTIIPLGTSGVLLYRNPQQPADGTLLRMRGDAGVFSAGGCSAIVAVRGRDMIFAHAGRDCVLDHTLVQTGKAGRPFASVVDSIMHVFGVDTSARAKEVHVFVFWSIRPEHFVHASDHPKYGDYNRALTRYLRDHYRYVWEPEGSAQNVDVPRIISEQFGRYGVPLEHIDLSSAYMPDNLPHTRNGDGKGRYLVAVVRR